MGRGDAAVFAAGHLNAVIPGRAEGASPEPMDTVATG